MPSTQLPPPTIGCLLDASAAASLHEVELSKHAFVLCVVLTALGLSSYAHVTLTEIWDDGALPVHVRDPPYPSTEATASRPAVTLRRFSSHFSSCDITVVVDNHASVDRVEQATRWARHADVLRPAATHPLDEIGDGPLQCTHGVRDVYVRRMNGDALHEYLTTSFGERRQPPSGVMPHTNGRLSLFLLLAPSSSMHDANGKVVAGCRGRRATSRHAQVLCGALHGNAREEVANTLDLLFHRIEAVRVARGPAMAPPQVQLARSLVLQNRPPSTAAVLLEDGLMDTIGPESASDVRDALEQLRSTAPVGTVPWPSSLPANAVDAELLVREPVEAWPTDVAEAVLRSPWWLPELLLPPEQYFALHLTPIYGPLVIALLNAAKVIRRRLRAARRRAAEP